MTFRFYNPFRHITYLRDLVTHLHYYAIACAGDRDEALCERDAYAQACEAFMGDRADLKAELGRVVDVALAVYGSLESAEAQHAQEIIEVISWVRQAEAALALRNLEVIDTPEGPVVRDIEEPQLFLPHPSAFPQSFVPPHF